MSNRLCGLLLVALGGCAAQAPSYVPLDASSERVDAADGGKFDSPEPPVTTLPKDPDPPRCVPKSCTELARGCGPVSDGCATLLDCGACDQGSECIDGQCSCQQDRAEPNDNPVIADGALGSYIDSDDPVITYTGYSLDDPSDVDWFVGDVKDGVDGGNPLVRVVLADIPSGASYRVTAYYVCADGDNDLTCVHGEVDNALGNGCISLGGDREQVIELETDCDNWTTDDDGQLFVRVDALGETTTCEPYTFTVTVS